MGRRSPSHWLYLQNACSCSLHFLQLHLLQLQTCLVLQEALRKAWHRAQQLVAHVSLGPADMPVATAMLALPQMSLVGTMMIPTVAANNAAAAANNVNANLNSVILQLSNMVGTFTRLAEKLKASPWPRSACVEGSIALQALTLMGIFLCLGEHSRIDLRNVAR